MSDATNTTALELSAKIACLVRAALAQLEAGREKPITLLDLVRQHNDGPSALLDPVRGALAQLVEAREHAARLREVIGDATLPDHGWGNGFGTIDMDTIDEHVAGAEALATPFREIERAQPKRRAAA